MINVEVDEDIQTPDPSQEGEDDLAKGATHYSDAVVTSTDWTVDTIGAQLEEGTINLTPSFQRRNAWRDDRKSRFIESLFLGLPIPEIVLAERLKARGTFLVLDGKQRLLTLREFCRPDGKDFPPLTLSGLAVRQDLNKMTYADLTTSGIHASDVRNFRNQTIRTVVVRNWPDEDFLYRVFLRLNTGSLPLSPQELRSALIPGPFLKFLDEFSSQCRPLQVALGISGPDFRMRDVELFLRFFAFDQFLSDYRGNLKEFLDMTSLRLNKSWPTSETAIRKRAEAGAAAIDTTLLVFSQPFKRWTRDRFEGRFNRAVFDIMIYSFRDPLIGRSAVAEKDAVVSLFQKLSAESNEFSQALTTTTKTVDAVWLRLTTWCGGLSHLLGIEIPVPAKPQLS
jgi:hypothetical protein